MGAFKCTNVPADTKICLSTINIIPSWMMNAFNINVRFSYSMPFAEMATDSAVMRMTWTEMSLRLE